MTTSREKKQRQGQARQDRLDRIAEQVAAGTLIIRQATVEERARYGITAPPPAEEVTDEAA